MPNDETLTLEGTEWQVSLSEKVSTGEYETFEPYVSLSGELPAPESDLDAETRTQVRRELTAVADDLRQVLDATIDDRLSAEEFPDE